MYHFSLRSGTVECRIFVNSLFIRWIAFSTCGFASLLRVWLVFISTWFCRHNCESAPFHSLLASQFMTWGQPWAKNKLKTASSTSLVAELFRGNAFTYPDILSTHTKHILYFDLTDGGRYILSSSQTWLLLYSSLVDFSLPFILYLRCSVFKRQVVHLFITSLQIDPMFLQ